MTAVAVVGHVEWVDFAVVDHVPRQGEILYADSGFAAPAGGGGVAAVQLRKLAHDALFLTAVGDDDLGERAHRELSELHGVDTHAAIRPEPMRRAFTHLDADAERTITVTGNRLVPHGDDDLPWERLDGCDAVYFTGGDVEALRRARAAKHLVATPRAAALAEAGVQLDVLVASGNDEGERPPALDPPPKHVVLTEGGKGGHWTGADGHTGRWAVAAPPGAPVDAYGCGDSFAAGLTYGLGAGLGLQGALEIAARCGAWCLTGRGPYGNQLEL